MFHRSTQEIIIHDQFDLLYRNFCSEEVPNQFASNKKSTWQTHRIFYIGLLVSLALHLLFASTLKNGFSNKLIETETMNKRISVEITSPLQRLTSQEENQLPLTEEVVLKKEQKNPSILKTEPKPALQPEKIKPTVQPKEVVQKNNKATKRIIFEDIRERISSDVLTENKQNKFDSSSFTITDPILRKQLDNALREQHSKHRVNQFGKTNKENEFYEFKSEGNVQTVRVNGNCFQVHQQTAFSTTSIPWLFMGRCKKLKKLDFKTRKLDREYLEGAH